MKQPKEDPSPFDRFLDVSPVISGIIIVLIMLAICVNVIMRYFLNRPIAGIDEISEYLLLFITFIGLQNLGLIVDHAAVASHRRDALFHCGQLVTRSLVESAPKNM